MKKSIRYILITVILAFVVLISGCTSISNFMGSNNDYSAVDTSYNKIADVSTKSFSAYGVNFKYPSSWNVLTDNSSGNNIISVTKGFSFNGAQLDIQIIPNNGMPEKEAIKEFQQSYTPGWTRNASYTITVSNKTCYEDVYTVNDSHYSKIMRIANIYYVKNDKSYLIMIQAPDSDFDKEKPYFSMILNSFKVR